MAVMSPEFGKDVLMLQLEKIKMMIEEDEDIMEILEDKPFVCGNQTILNYPRSLRIQVKISYHNFEED